MRCAPRPVEVRPLGTGTPGANALGRVFQEHGDDLAKETVAALSPKPIECLAVEIWSRRACLRLSPSVPRLPLMSFCPHKGLRDAVPWKHGTPVILTQS